MYSPSYNRIENRAELLAFMRANSFCVLVTGTGGALQASHLPVLVRERDEGLVIETHMARANPQWREIFDDEDVLVVFPGPHAYVSPRWYAQKERVPTWNYAAVHAYGSARIIEERDLKLASQRRLVAELDPEWLPAFDALSREYIANMLDGIVNIEVPLARMDSRWKLSQNRGRDEQERIVAQLDRSADSSARALAALMRRHLEPE
jgi:transcriptional regulator